MANCNDDDDYDLDDFVQGISTTLTIGIDLILLPGFINLATIHLMRQVYAEKRHRKKKRR
jgi:hypothetical protein